MSGVNYLDKLLDGAEVEWLALGDVVHMRAGQHISASNITEEASNEHPYPCFGGNGIRGFVAKNSHDGRHLLIGRQGALCGNVQRTTESFTRQNTRLLLRQAIA
jgi:type I restriction enzyme S subunit